MKHTIAIATSALTLCPGAYAALTAGQTLGIDFGDGIHNVDTSLPGSPNLNGSGAETNFAVLVQLDNVLRAPNQVNVIGQSIPTDITGTALSGVSFTTSTWTGFLAAGDQVGYNAAGTGNYTGTNFSDLSFNDGIFGNNSSSITISGLNNSLTYNLSVASHMFVGTNFGGTVTEPISGASGSYTSTSIINGGTSTGPNPNPITPFELTGLQTDGSGNLTLNFTNNPIIISALTVTAVPEPSSAVLIGLASLGLLRRRRK